MYTVLKPTGPSPCTVATTVFSGVCVNCVWSEPHSLQDPLQWAQGGRERWYTSTHSHGILYTLKFLIFAHFTNLVRICKNKNREKIWSEHEACYVFTKIKPQKFPRASFFTISRNKIPVKLYTIPAHTLISALTTTSTVRNSLKIFRAYSWINPSWCLHKPMGIYFNTRRYTLVHGFCFF